ncbi:hypothetical protein NM208_g17043 [Fusarium decemcellulare]|uniref:Uncharacterized protein n=1 Tax=Fusarium decemcellulare TaxID=57161 RepID=A0ACC1R8I4_9HYPO|nr:hypothetical protein NM208_g17043 [Fusarium decemcellulare]
MSSLPQNQQQQPPPQQQGAHPPRTSSAQPRPPMASGASGHGGPSPGPFGGPGGPGGPQGGPTGPPRTGSAPPSQFQRPDNKPSPAPSAATAPPPKAGKGPATFEDMGIPQGKQDSDCLRLSNSEDVTNQHHRAESSSEPSTMSVHELQEQSGAVSGNLNKRDEERGNNSPEIRNENDQEEEMFEMSIFEEMVSQISSAPSIINPSPPPDGGWRAWCVCLSSHLVYMNTWGWVNSFGIFQAYYTELLSRPASEISWIGSISVFLLFFVGTLTGRLVDAGYFRHVFIAGMVFQVTGVLVTSVCTEYWHFLVAQGVLVGLGNGCIFCPILAVLSTYFARRRALAMGIAACGSATGGMIFPSLVRQLLPRIGFEWTVRIAGFTHLVTLTTALVLAKPRIRPRGSSSFVDLSAFKDVEYMLMPSHQLSNTPSPLIFS